MRNTGPTPVTVEMVLNRAGWRCEICGATVGRTRGLDWSIHHRRPRQMGGTRWAGINMPSNLLLLCGHGCSGCHGDIESYRAEAVESGWIVPSGLNPAKVAVLLVRSRWRYLTDDGSYAEAVAA